MGRDGSSVAARATRRRLPGLVVVALAVAMVTVGAAWLRETPLFWRNAGGYPIWMRDLVGAGFFPLVALDVALGGYLLARLAGALSGRQRLHRPTLVVVLAVAVLDAVALVLVILH